ncbi:hypothetical protein AMATHDRAFT_5864 [Amanita thiersii Skay4041]|uniref:DUF7918 domain-containing protein n=1 Tax=Amanita thiersii Skay4041 TaxID=703135 RepID=A0A2A9NKY8_9AGAR|nr:hypothetical protein AMATHDRAFT_5864 [Amanita thiersii Skay4041]
MPEYAHFEVEIKVDDKVLQEYAINVNDEAKTVTCWVPSETGKAFAVWWKNFNPVTDTIGQVYLDGTKAGKKGLHKGQRRKVKKSYLRISETMVRPFVFSTLTLTDDDAHLDTPLNDLGEIKLAISRCTVKPNSGKALVHRAGFGDQYTRSYDGVVNYNKFEVLATFIFKYRPLDFLQANGIVPKPLPLEPKAQTRGKKRKRSVSRSETLEIPDGPSDEEDAQRLKALQAEIQQIEARRAKRPKLIPEVKTEQKPIIIDGVIDLT